MAVIWCHRCAILLTDTHPVGLSPHRAEHFGFPPSAPRLGNQRPWYVQPCLCDWAYIQDPVPLIEKRRGLSPGGRFPSSFIHQVIIS